MKKLNYRKKRFTASVLSLIIVFSAGWYYVYRQNKANYLQGLDDYIKIMDVGQADSILICSNGYSALIDAGDSSSFNDIRSDIKAAGIKNVDVAVITHYHDDHQGSFAKLCENFQIDNVIIPAKASGNEEDFAKIMSVARESKIYIADRGMNFKIGDFELTVLAQYSESEEENNRSIIIMAEKEGKRFLFTGDAEKSTEKMLIADKLDIDCDVLKVGHHGSTSSSSEEFLNTVTPEYAAISVGKNNRYSHPDKSTLDSLKNCNSEVYRTDINGDIVFYIEDGKIKVKTEK